MSVLDISKMLMYEFWYDYIKPKYQYKAKLCYMDTNSFVIRIKTENFYEDIAIDVENRFDTLNYSKYDKRPLAIGMNKKVIRLFKDELSRKIMIEFLVLKAKTYTYLMDDDSKHKKVKETKMCVLKRKCLKYLCLKIIKIVNVKIKSH